MTINQFWTESKQLKEDFHKYWLTQIKGGFGWVPFEGKYQSKETIDQSIDFSNIKCPLTFMSFPITSMIAKFEKIEYNFTDMSCGNLATMFLALNQKEQSNQAKHFFHLNESFSQVSLSKFLSLIEQVPKDVYTLKVGKIEWENHYENSIKINEISEQKDGYFELATDVGTNLLQVCIDQEQAHKAQTDNTDENTEQGTSKEEEEKVDLTQAEEPEDKKWVNLRKRIVIDISKIQSKKDYTKSLERNSTRFFQECFEFLLDHRFNPDAENLEHGETMLFYSLMRGKTWYSERLLQYFEKEGKTPRLGANKMSPIAATVIKPNFKCFERLFKLHNSNIEDLIVIDKELTKNKPRSLLSYICKKHVKLEGKDKEIIKIFKFLI